MTPTLSEDQRRAIEEHGGCPVYVVDPSTNEHFVLVQAKQYEQLQALYSEESFEPREAYPFVDRVMADDDANDPSLANYQELQKRS